MHIERRLFTFAPMRGVHKAQAETSGMKRFHGERAGARKPRLLVVSISFQPEPGTVMGLPVAKLAAESGNFDVEVLTAVPWYPLGRKYPGYRWKWFQTEAVEGVPVHRVPLVPSHDSSGARRILTYVSFTVCALILGLPRMRRADVVYYFDSLPTTGVVAWACQLLWGARTVQHIGDLWPDTVTESGMLPARLGPVVSTIVGGWVKFLYRRHSGISVASPGIRDELVHRGVAAEKVKVVYTWAFEDIFFPTPRDETVRRGLAADDQFLVVYAGNLGPLQDLETVVEAATLLKDREDIRLVIMGSGQSQAGLVEMIDERRLRNIAVIPARPLAEMNAVNMAADALLIHLRDIPLMHRTTPSKTQVAMACGRPVLMGVGGDAAALTREAGSGICFPPSNPQAMAEAIRQIADLAPAQRAEMGARGRSYYEEHLSLRAAGKAMLSLFNDAAAG